MLNLYIYDFYTKYSDIYSSVYIEPLYIFYTSIHFMCYTQLPPCFSIEGWIYIYLTLYRTITLLIYSIPYSTLHIFLLSPSSTEIYTALPSSSLPPSLPDGKKYTVPYTSSKFPTIFVIPFYLYAMCYTIFSGEKIDVKAYSMSRVYTVTIHNSTWI